MAGLNKEIWLEQLIEPTYAEASFMDFAQDMTMHVENNTINLAEAGLDPDVLVNNTTYPIAMVERVDNPLAIPLDRFDTVNTVVRAAERAELSYDKVESVIKGHRRSLRIQSLKRAAHAYAPQTTSTFTPTIDCSGPVRPDTSRKRMTLADLSAMKTKMTLLEGGGKFIAVLHPYHLADLKAEDSNFNKNYVDYAGGTIVSKLENFLIIEYPSTPVYTSAGVKKAYGAIAVPATDCYSSFCFMEDEVMKADGEADMFSRLNDPEARGDIIGFNKRFKALPIRNKYIGAWISKP